MTNPWESAIPTTPSNKNLKRCYKVYNQLFGEWLAGGKVVWLTDHELTLANIKYPNKIFKPVLEKDTIEEYRRYMDQTVD
jgi:hypothetical protein